MATNQGDPEFRHAVGPDSDKYDRQLRLWGSHGQRRLAEARVLLINGSATGTETLKNLVLPGIGQFTVVDSKKVDATDVESNFFVDAASLGKPRAEVVKDYLVELNPDVAGYAVVRDPVTLDADFLSKFTLVVATQLPEVTLLKIAAACWSREVPLIVARTFGLMGHVRVCVKEHRIVESKAQTQPDLSISEPFPQLAKLADSIDMRSLPDHEYKHVPFVVVLVKLAQEWRAAHGGQLPKTMEEKNKFKESIKALKRGAWGEEENLTEAYASAYLAYTRKEPSDAVAAVMEEAKAMAGKPGGITKATHHFWIMAAALAEFHARTGTLPLSSSLPDMTATTQGYINLQRAFKERSNEDLAAFSGLVDSLLQKAGLPVTTIPATERLTFAANAHTLVVIRTKSLAEEFATSPASTSLNDALGMTIAEDSSSQCPALWYLAWRGCDAVFAKKGRYPGGSALGELPEDVARTDAEELLDTTRRILEQTYGMNKDLVTASHAEEMVRYGGAEPHSIAAFVGGLASQEAVKLITMQFVPMNDTYFYNGVTGVGGVWEL